ncbi:MAG: leucine-rich repeat domain-containing protein, partial [Clostridia bacterium]|nr:leucine-rich repeat domain-containing protein [Clostridia bacterium]
MTKTRNKLKIMGPVLTMVLLRASLGVFSLTASAAEATIIASGECGTEDSNVQWTLDDSGTLTVSGTGAMENFNANPLPWADYCDSITSVVIKEGVTTIGREAFLNCSKMTNVEIPSSVTYIGVQAFNNCDGLEIVTIPGSVHTIDDNAFYGCDELTTVKISNGVVSIGQSAFCNSRKLTSVELPESVTSIGRSAFNGCSALESIRIPQGVTEIQDSTFSACTSLKTIEIPDGVTSIGQLVFYKCSALESIKLPKGVTEIQANAFGRCTSLTSIELPEDLTLIGNSAFWGCTALQSIHIPDKVTSIDGGALGGCESLTEIEIPHSVTHIGKNAFNGNINMSKVTVSCAPQFSYDFGDGVTLVYKDHSYTGCICTVCEESYSHLGSLSKIVPTEDGKHTATWSCCGVVMVEDHNPDKESYQDLENGTHSFTCTDCGTITEAHSWEKSACTLCGATCSHSLVENVCTVCGIATGFCGVAENEGGEESVWWTYENGTLIFDGDGAMAEYNLSRPWGAYGDSVTTIVIEEGVTTIADFAFQGFTALESIEIPQGVVKIGVQAFDGCSALKSIDMPDSVTQLGMNAFHACTVLESIKLSNGLDMISKGVFENCRSLTTLAIPNHLTAIDNRAFYNCIGLTSVKIPHSVKHIGEAAFEGCTSLTTVTTSCDPQFNYAFGDGVTLQREHLYENGFCTECDAFQPAVYNEEKGYYEISNAGQLFWFAAEVNGGNTEINGKLMTDIDLNPDYTFEANGTVTKGGIIVTEGWRAWTPIGTEANRYNGIFDGNGKTISGLYFNDSTGNNVGLFGYIYDNGQVKAVTLTNSTITGYDCVGGIAGKNYGIITGCVNNALVSGFEDVGGIVGINYGTVEKCGNTNKINCRGNSGGIVGRNSDMIRNCYNTGDVHTNLYSAGGIVGFNNSGTAEYCWSTGAVTTDYEDNGGIAGKNDGALQYCYSAEEPIGSYGSNGTYSYVDTRTAAQFASGEVAYLLGSAWGQTIGTNATPVFATDANKVYQSFECDGTTPRYTNDASLEGKVAPHTFGANSNGFCTECNQGYQPATLNSEGYYEIDNAGKLFWFAGLVNGTLTDGTAQNTSANAILTKDIVVNEGTMTAEITGARAWTPIGNSSNRYSGTFNGNGKTVSGLYFNDSGEDYVGLFGYVGTNGKVQNVGVIDSYFRGYGNVGGVVGRNYGTVTNCFNSSDLMGSNLSIGGVVGRNDGTVANCYNSGSVTGGNDTSWLGGVVGCNNGTVTGCYNTGAVHGKEDVGGVVGENSGTVQNCYNLGEVGGYGSVGGVVGDNHSTVINCYNASNVIAKSNGSATAIAGGVVGINSDGTVTNSYYNKDMFEDGAIGKNGTSENVEGKTTTQFESGEVAYLLGSAWGQTLGTNATPVFATDASKVYQSFECDGTTPLYTNDASLEGKAAPHTFGANSNGFCTECDAFQPAVYNEERGYYEISNAGQLFWFAGLVNGTLTDGTAQNASANATLTDPIDLNIGATIKKDGTYESLDGLREWTPIGSSTTPYAGAFRGGQRSISHVYINSTDDYQGLFGDVTGTVTGCTVRDSYVKGKDYVGGVIGYLESSGDLLFCKNESPVTGETYVGGVVGYADSVNLVNECANEGKVVGTEYVGGLIGYASYEVETIVKCENSGFISGE